MGDYIISDDLGFVNQMRNFSEKLPNYQATLGLTNQQIADVKKDYEFLRFAVSAFAGANNYKKSWARLKDSARKGKGSVPISPLPTPVDTGNPPAAVPPGIGKRFRALAQHLKTHINYTLGIGKDLGIEMPEQTPDFNKYMPMFIIVRSGDSLWLKYKKMKADGVEVLKSVDGSDFVTISKDMRPPFEDKSPRPAPGKSEVWKYRMIYLKNDARIGDWSNEVSITVTG